MTEYTPTVADVRTAWIQAHAVPSWGGQIDIEARPRTRIAEIDRFFAAHDAEVAANALREFATHLDGGTPRAWGFHHPCDAAGVRWEPTPDDLVTMSAADNAREAADRIERTASTPQKENA